MLQSCQQWNGSPQLKGERQCLTTKPSDTVSLPLAVVNRSTVGMIAAPAVLIRSDMHGPNINEDPQTMFSALGLALSDCYQSNAFVTISLLLICYCTPLHYAICHNELKLFQNMLISAQGFVIKFTAKGSGHWCSMSCKISTCIWAGLCNCLVKLPELRLFALSICCLLMLTGPNISSQGLLVYCALPGGHSIVCQAKRVLESASGTTCTYRHGFLWRFVHS